MSLFPSIFFVPIPLSLCMDYRVRRTFFPSGWCFFYLVTTGWIFYISLCENSIKKIIHGNSIRMQSNRVGGYLRTVCISSPVKCKAKLSAAAHSIKASLAIRDLLNRNNGFVVHATPKWSRL